jgi:hypothetical protein
VCSSDLYSIAITEEGVAAGAESVIVTSGTGVVVNDDIPVNRSAQFSLLTIRGTSFTLSKYNGSEFMDWKTSDGTGVTYSSFLITGYELFGDIMRQKQIPYLFFYLQQTEDGFTAAGSGTGAHFTLNNQSSCKVQAQWNWANSSASGQWGQEFEAYRLLRNFTPSGAGAFDSGDSMVVTKNKLRGSGKCISLFIKSETGKDMRLLGWGYPVTMATTQ